MEITKNRDQESDSFGTYHPHFHVLMCVPTYYFKMQKYYITQDEWTILWKKSDKTGLYASGACAKG
ncbi:protein rep [Camelliibacillus cellulosilyticus]|uniref:Protein rep n=1 Tax=Camelliibacillus cellulosilyticus TaxID=2174486 RepID=A0ABV9GM20_9BACL